MFKYEHKKIIHSNKKVSKSCPNKTQTRDASFVYATMSEDPHWKTSGLSLALEDGQSLEWPTSDMQLSSNSKNYCKQPQVIVRRQNQPQQYTKIHIR